MTQEQKEVVESALVEFIKRVAKNGTNAEVEALPGAVHALISLGAAHINLRQL